MFPWMCGDLLDTHFDVDHEINMNVKNLKS